MKLLYSCINKNCDRTFYKEYNRNCHILFDHQFLMPVCSTGISEKIFKDNMVLIEDFRRKRRILGSYKTELKKKYLKSVYFKVAKQYGKDYMKNKNLSDEFNMNMEKYHEGIFTRIKYLNTTKYDEFYDSVMKMLSIIENKGLILG